MLTNTDGVQEQQGSVCVTRGDCGLTCEVVGPHDLHWHRHSYTRTHTWRIPAPVVLGDYQPFPSLWAMRPTPSQHAHAHEWIEVGGSGPYCRICGQWPSQDAEGDGLDAAWRHYDAMVAMSSQESEGREGRAKYAAMAVDAREVVESAIRAPYEELVRRGRAVLDDQQAEYECGFCSGSNAEHEDECVIPPFKAALESLGGRS